MQAAEQKVLQYLNEAHASEQALARVLESQIAMTPKGGYRDALDAHHRETHDHARRVQERITELGDGSTLITAVVGLAESVVGQAVALGKTPLDLLRGSGGEEKVLKNAKDTCATEALEIATYTALEQLATSVGDTTTAKLAASIRADEEKMLERVLGEIPKLTEAVVNSDVHGDGSYDIATTGAGETARKAGTAAKKTAKKATAETKSAARKTGSTAARNARKVPGVADAEGVVKGAAASESDLPIARYDSLTASEITDKLTELSQIQLTTVDVYERKNQGRSTVLSRIESLRGDEPWKGYDELTVQEIKAVLSKRDEAAVKAVRAYERAHKDRTGVLEAAEQELATA